MEKRTVYRVGDTVRIVEPKFVERVGYPLVWPMLMPEFTAKLSVVREAMKDLILDGVPEEELRLLRRIRTEEPDAIDKDFLRGVCMAAVRMRSFGGCVRSLHHHPDDTYANYRRSECDVLRKRTVKTGTRFAPWSGQSYEGEWDYEPGGLSDERTHVLLALDIGLEIEADNVELVSRAEPMFYVRNTRQVVGNSVLWWCVDGHGYTCDLSKAWKVPESKARSICRDRPDEDVMVPARVAEAAAERRVDSQSIPLTRRQVKVRNTRQVVGNSVLWWCVDGHGSHEEPDMSQKIRIRSGQVVKLELNDACVDELRAAWSLYKAWHEDIHGSAPGYSDFVSKLIVMSAAEINKCTDENMRALLNTRISQ